MDLFFILESTVKCILDVDVKEIRNPKTFLLLVGSFVFKPFKTEKISD